MSLVAGAGSSAKSPWQKSYAPRILRDARRSDEHIPPARSVERGTAMAQAAVVPAGPLIDRGPLRRPDRPGPVTPRQAGENEEQFAIRNPAGADAPEERRGLAGAQPKCPHLWDICRGHDRAKARGAVPEGNPLDVR
jgi:hypothetical protein